MAPEVQRQVLDTDRVVRRFYSRFKSEQDIFQTSIQGISSQSDWVCPSRATARVAPTFLLMGRHRQQVCPSRATARVAPTLLLIKSRVTEHWGKTAYVLLFTATSCCLCSSENWVRRRVKIPRHST